jgi:hypothetical protein
MAGKSPRDKCFGEAVDAYNDAHPDDQLPVETQKPWVLDSGKWRPATLGEKIWNWIRGGDPFRVPDWTITLDGRPVAGDNKFEGDGYSSRKGRSGKTQLEDQNDMNSHQNPDKPEYQDLNLNPDKCKCDDDPQPEEVYDPALAPLFVPLPGAQWQFAPGGAPAPAPAIRPVIPEFAFP